MRTHYNGNGIITGHPIEPLYGRTYLPKKFKIAFTVPGDNSVDLYINDIGCVVIMEPDGETLKGFNIVVGGGMGRTHRKEETFARAADHLGFVHKDDFFEAMKAILAAQRDHGNREVRSSARSSTSCTRSAWTVPLARREVLRQEDRAVGRRCPSGSTSTGSAGTSRATAS